MRRMTSLAVILALIPLLAIGCVSKGTYDGAIKELGAAKSELSTTQSQLSSAQSDLSTAQQKLSATTQERDSLKASLTALQKSHTELTDQVKTAQKYWDVAALYVQLVSEGMSIILGGISGPSTGRVLVLMGNMTTAITATGDQPLQTSWNAFLANPNSIPTQVAFLNVLSQRLTDTKPKTNGTPFTSRTVTATFSSPRLSSPRSA